MDDVFAGRQMDAVIHDCRVGAPEYPEIRMVVPYYKRYRREVDRYPNISIKETDGC